MSKKNWVIFSFAATQNDLEHEPLFWSNEDGWVALSTATKFTEEQVKWYILPDDGKAVQLSERSI